MCFPAVPELQLFARRWHIASDSFPLIALILAGVHGVWVLLFLIGSFTLEYSGLATSCQDASLLLTAHFGLLFLFFVSFATESAIASLGLRGGPLETQKRRAIPTLLYLKLGIWVVMLGWTVFETWLVTGDRVSNACFVHDPCVNDPAGCASLKGATSPPLSPDCQYTVQDQKQFFACQKQWADLSASWYYQGNCSGNQTLAFWLEGWAQASEEAQAAGEALTLQELIGWFRANGPYLAFTSALVALLDSQGVSYDPHAPMISVPWFACLSGACQDVLSVATNCTQWDSMLVLEPTTSKKSLFQGIVYSSWAAIAITALVMLLAFNTTPDYTDVESWEGTVKSFARCMCCRAVLEAADMADTDEEMGESASKEIAKSLYLLFGGVDLDPTDRLLGLALVSKEQHRRRREHAAHALQQAGALGGAKPGFFRRVASGLASWLQKRRARDGSISGSQPSKSAASAAPWLRSVEEAGEGQEGGAEGGPAVVLRPTGSLLVGLGDLHTVGKARVPDAAAASAADGLEQAEPAEPKQQPAASLGISPPSSHHMLAPSPFSMAQLPPRPGAEGQLPGGSRAVFSTEQGSQLGQKGESSPQILYRRSKLRLISKLLLNPHASYASFLTQLAHTSPSGGGPGAPACTMSSPHQEAEPSGGSEAQAGKAGGRAGEVEIRVVQQYAPLLTPVPLPYKVEATPQEAAVIYSGRHEAVPRAVLEEAQHMSRFATASYGLQSSMWARGNRPPMCYANLNRLLKLVGKPLRIENKFRVRNFKAIMAITGVAPSDLLYVSYANAPGGVLPYMIMLHHPTKSVVISVRGSVSMQDVVTDLLSSPADVGNWLPDWVHQANTSGEKMYAHAGIKGSTAAILKDMEKHGLLQELLESQQSRTLATCTTFTQHVTDVSQQQPLTESSSSEFVAPSRAEDEEEEVCLPAQRAQTMIRERLAVRGWKVVVTGHSLGAAVACLLSFHLKDSFPDLKCWAFSPPGGLLSWNLSRIAQSFCTSVVVGKDVISRLSFSTARRVVDEMVTSLARCKRPKLVVMFEVLLTRRKRDLPPRTFCGYNEISDEAVRALEGYYRSSMLHAGEQVELYPPGRLILFRPFKGRKAKQTLWDAVWVAPPALLAEGILVSPSMLAHHRMFTLHDALRSVLAGEAEHAQHAEPGTVAEAVPTEGDATGINAV